MYHQEVIRITKTGMFQHCMDLNICDIRQTLMKIMLVVDNRYIGQDFLDFSEESDLTLVNL